MTNKLKFGQIKPNLGHSINWGHPLAKGLVGHWLMNEGTGNVVQDLSGNDHTGTLVNNAIWGAGTKYGMGVICNDATNRRITVPHSTALDMVGEYTIIVGLNTQDSGTGGFIGKRNGAAVWWGWGTFLGKLIFWTNTNSYPVSTATGYNDGLDHIVAFTRRGTTGIFYQDGRFLESKTVDGADLSNTASLEIGLMVSDSYVLDGTIYFVYLFNRALSASEVAALSAKPFGMFRPTFSVWWYSGIGGEPPVTSIPIFMYHYLNH